MYAKTPQMRTCKNRALTALVSETNLKRKYLPRNLWREITTKSFVKNYQPNKLGRKKYHPKKSEEKVFTKKSLKRNHYQKLCEKIINQINLEEKNHPNKNLKRKYLPRNLWREITTFCPADLSMMVTYTTSHPASNFMTSKQVTSPPCNSKRLVHGKEMVWASRWSVALSHTHNVGPRPPGCRSWSGGCSELSSQISNMMRFEPAKWSIMLLPFG